MNTTDPDRAHDRYLVLELYPDLTVNEIAEKLDRSRWFVYNALRRKGLTITAKCRRTGAITANKLYDAIAQGDITEQTDVVFKGKVLYRIVPVDQVGLLRALLAGKEILNVYP